MSETLLTFDEEYQPEITNTLNKVVENVQQKMVEAESLSVDEAEKLLDDACNGCINTFTSKIEEIRASAKKAKPNPSSSTFTEDKTKYTAYVTAVATGIDQSTSLFENVIQRIRNIVSTAIDWIKTGAAWMWDQLVESFTIVKSLWIK